MHAMKKIIALIIAGLTVVAVSIALAGPAKNVSPKRHPNIAAAQDLVNKAYAKIEAAQKANEWDLGGHAEKAKALLVQASDELKLAAETANANPPSK
jgi:hypothetical protein